MPDISVLIAVHNAMAYLPEAVESMLAQTYRDIQIVIVDDASTDSTKDYISGLGDSRVRLLRLAAKSGQGAARNRGIETCDTEFVAIMDGDDISLPNRFAEQIAFLRSHPQVGMVGTQFQYLGSQGRRGFGGPLPLDHEGIFNNLLAGQHALANGSLLCRTELLKQVGGYALESPGEDWGMFLRMGEQARLANLPEVHYLYRVHPQSSTEKQLDLVRLRTDYAARCAQLRQAGLNEISLDAYLAERQRRPLHSKALDVMNRKALERYRRGVSKILYGRPASGYCWLALASLSSPPWTVKRLQRAARKRLGGWRTAAA